MIALETHALFIRFWLGQMPPLPAEAQAAANALGQGPVSGHAGATTVSGAVFPG